MAPGKWDDEESDSSSSSSPAAAAPIARRSKFDDEEENEDVLESWDAADDSEVEREKARKAEVAKAKAEAEAKANHKSKAQRVEEHRQAALRRRQMEDDGEEDEEETEAERRARLRQQEIDGSRAQAEELFGELAVSKKKTEKAIVVHDDKEPGNAIDLSSLSIFNPNTKDQFAKLRDTITPLIAGNSKKGQYSLFLQEFCKQISKDLPSEQIKKIASGLTALSNEKMKEEKAAEKGGKKTKAAKTKTTLNASRDTGVRADTSAYDDDFGDDDFM